MSHLLLLWAATAAAAPGLPSFLQTREGMSPQERTAVELFRRLDLSAHGLDSAVRKLKQRDYAGALALWRDAAVQRLRTHDFGHFGWHGYKGHPRPVTLAKYYCGAASEEDLRKWHPKLTLANGSSARITTGNFEDPLPSLAYCYWQSGDPLYMRRALELMDDFCSTNQAEFWRRFRGRLDGEQVPTEPALAEWRLNVNALECGWRLKNFMQTLAGLAKCMGTDRPADWDDVLRPCLEPTRPEQLDAFSPERLARVAISGYEHHAGRLLWFCLHPGAVPNQRATGLKALLMLNIIFPNFSEAPQLSELRDMAYSEMVESNFLPDGGSLEQSFNYNSADMKGLEEVAALYGTDNPPHFVKTMLQKAAARRAVSDGLRDPLAGLPQVGNGHAVMGKSIWSDEAAAQRYLESVNPGGKTAATPQPYLSKAYPYSGFYALREGWGIKDLYLFFMNGRPQRGHSMRDSLAVQVTAYGRQMVACGGSPTYGSHRNDDAKGADFYLSEKSSLKNNTVIVDGKSQAKNAPTAMVAPQTPVKSRFHTSEHFDLVDGRYALGYETPDNKNRQLDMSVEHERTVVFVREAKLWVVIDRMSAAGAKEHRYTQIWNFMPYVEDTDTRKSAAGFRPEQFAMDARQRRFGTTDAEGPNIEFIHFGPRQVEYRKYFGDREKWLGWYARGIGDAIPAVDVHANWRSTHGDTLVTLLVPRDKGTESPVASAQSLDRPDAGLAGFTSQLRNGAKLSVLCAGAAQALRLGDFRAQAQALVLYESSDKTAGMVRGGRELALPNGEKLACETDCFEFSRDGKGRWTLSPTRFPEVPRILPPPQPVLAMRDHPPVTIESGSEPAEVRYTLDGRDPDAASPAYREPLRLTADTTVKARYSRRGRPLPLVATRHYRAFRYRLRAPDRLDSAGLEPGLRYCYAKRPRWSRLYDLMKEAEYKPLEAGKCDSIALRPRDKLKRGQAAVVFTGFLNIPRDGIYTFHVKARDGVYLFICNPERDLELPAAARCTYLNGEGHGSAALKAGYHKIQIAYKKSADSDVMAAEVQGPGISRRPLPAEWCFRERE